MTNENNQNKQPGRSIYDIQGEINTADELMRKAEEAHRNGNITGKAFEDLAQLAAIGQSSLSHEREDVIDEKTGRRTKISRRIGRMLFGKSHR